MLSQRVRLVPWFNCDDFICVFLFLVYLTVSRPVSPVSGAVSPCNHRGHRCWYGLLRSLG